MNIIFDFDGTLADTLPQARELFDRLKVRAPITDEEVDYWRGLTLIQVLKHVGIPLWKVPRLLVQARADLAQIIKHAEMIRGLDKVIRNLKKDGHKLLVVSSNSEENIEEFLKRFKIRDQFDHIYGGASIFGKYKNIRNVIKINHLDTTQTFYVGDETRDIEAARKAAIRSVSVTWGFNAARILKRHDPDYIIDTPKKLAKLFKNI